MDEIVIDEVQEVEAEVIPDEDNAELLEIDNTRRKKEGRADDAVTMQTALCMIIAVGLIILNIFRPDTADELFSNVKERAFGKNEIISNPIDIITDYIHDKNQG